MYAQGPAAIATPFPKHQMDLNLPIRQKVSLASAVLTGVS